jgi:hypothetical protein
MQLLDAAHEMMFYRVDWAGFGGRMWARLYTVWLAGIVTEDRMESAGQFDVETGA